MSTPFRKRLTMAFRSQLAASATLALIISGAHAQTIDFETLPDGTPTLDRQLISNQYAVAPYGVEFALVDASGVPAGFPEIAKVGPPLTAFQGCPGDDQPLPGQGVGQSFLTTGLGGPELLVTYVTPVEVASGQLLDVDLWTGGGVEEWTISARDASNAVIDQMVITGPQGPDACSLGGVHGPGNATTVSWTVRSPTSAAEIASIRFQSTGSAVPNIAFDNFSASGPAVNYCSAGTSASGCNASLSATGTASASSSSGFTVSATTVEGNKSGIFFFGTNGPQANPWGNGTSYQCVVPPVRRAGLLFGGGTLGACDGTFSQDLNALWCPTCPKPGHNPGAGAVVQAQLWYRDPANTSNQTTSLSDALEFQLAP